METTLVLLKPSCVQRQLIGEIVNRLERRGLRISGMKMMQLSDEILREHYAHLVDRPFFPSLAASMQASPVVALALTGVDAVQVVRTMTGATNEHRPRERLDVERSHRAEALLPSGGDLRLHRRHAGLHLWRRRVLNRVRQNEIGLRFLRERN